MCKLTKIYIITIELLMNAIITEQYHVGDTVDISIKNNQISDIFNGYDGSKFIETEYFGNENKYQITPESCLLFESLEKYFYSKVYVDGKSSTTEVSKSFHYTYFSRDPNYGIHPSYVNNNHFRYGIVKLCKIIQTQYINSTWMQFPNINSNVGYKILLDTTAILRFKRDNETHYISSMSTGKCLVQIYVKDVKFCKNYNTSKSLSAEKEFFKIPISKSRIMTVTNDITLEHKIDEHFFVNDIDYSLYTFFDQDGKHKDVFNKINYSSAMILELQPLPEFIIPESQTVKLKNKIEPENIVPGDLINIKELLDSNQKNLSMRNVILERDYFVTAPLASWKFEKCFEDDKTQNFESSELNYFHHKMKLQNYGIDRNDVPDYVVCLMITICSGFRKQTSLLPDLKIIKLNEKSKDNTKKNIFENENIMLLLSDNNETHYVRQTDEGDCLLQVLVYPKNRFGNLDSMRLRKSDPYIKSRVLSSSNNRTLEKWAETVSEHDFRNIIGDENNVTMAAKIFDKLNENDPSNKTLISLYLDELI